MKTTAMAHQVEAGQRLAANPEFYALACEQGTGKTWMLIDDIERQYKSGSINAVLVVAPNGVHSNWIRREIPTHMSVEWSGRIWRSGMGKRELAHVMSIFKADVLPILALSFDAINTKAGYDIAKLFLTRFNVMMIIDESSRIKTPTANRTKKLITLGELAESRRIASGTMITNSPADVFSQFEFLSPGGKLLGTNSFRAFVAEYTELIPESSPLVQKIMEGKPGWMPAPQIARRDAEGRPIYKNLDKLREKMNPYTYRVLKSECLDLPEKIYRTIGFDLPPEQMRVYKSIMDELRFMRSDGLLDNLSGLTKLIKARQAVSGFYMEDGHPVGLLPITKNPRLQLLRELIEDIPESESFVIWASFREEHEHIAKLLKELEIPFVAYHGGVDKKLRDSNVDLFQSREARCFVGEAGSGGIGLTLTAGTNVIYYSNDYSLEKRLQSEDRTHRKGTTEHVLYTDIAANDTIDEIIAGALQRKEETASAVLNHLD